MNEIRLLSADQTLCYWFNHSLWCWISDGKAREFRIERPWLGGPYVVVADGKKLDPSIWDAKRRVLSIPELPCGTHVNLFPAAEKT